MLDFSMGEIGLVAAVALVVLGPDKLPQVAKTVGSLMGRAQRFVSQVKNDIDKEIELSELKKIQEDAKKMASDLENNLKNTQSQIEKEVKGVSDSVNSLGQDMQKQMDSATQGIKDSWLKETSPKASSSEEASIENMVETAEEAKPVVNESGDQWPDVIDQIDEDGLENAFNWPDSQKESVQSSVLSQLNESDSTTQSHDKASVQVSAQMLEDLLKEVQALKAQISQGNSQPKLAVGKFSPRSHVNKIRIHS